MGGLADVASLTARLSRSLADRDVRHAISGDPAMAAHGLVRTTTSVEILVVAPSLQWARAFEAVREHGFSGGDRELIASLRDRYAAEMRSGPWAVEIFVPVLPYHGTLVDRAVRIDVNGVDVPFVSLEDLIVLKFLWHRTKDVADAHALIAGGGLRIDAEYVRVTLGSILPADDARHEELRGLLERFGG